MVIYGSATAMQLAYWRGIGIWHWQWHMVFGSGIGIGIDIGIGDGSGVGRRLDTCHGPGTETCMKIFTMFGHRGGTDRQSTDI